MTPGAILAALSSFFKIILGVFGFIERRQEAVKESEQEAAGAAKVGAAAAAKAAEQRKEDERQKAEVAQRSDAELSTSYNRWVR